MEDRARVHLRFLGVRHALTGRHEVELTRTNRLDRSQVVPVEDLPLDEPGHCLQADVRMRADVHAAITAGGSGTEVVGEAPGADGPTLPPR